MMSPENPCRLFGIMLYTLGGCGGPNRDPFNSVYAYEVDRDRWTAVAPLPRARGAGSAAVPSGRIHLVGGAVSMPGERTSVAWHEGYGPQRTVGRLSRLCRARATIVG